VEGQRGTAVLPHEHGPRGDRGDVDDRARIHRADRSRTADGIRTRTQHAHRDGHGRIGRLTMTTDTTAPAGAQDQHGHVDPASTLIGSRDDVTVPVQTRSERPRSFDPADFGTPTGREVNWKHTPIARISPLFEQSTANDGVTYTFTSGEKYVAEPLGIG